MAIRYTARPTPTVRFELAAASSHFCVAFPPNWPIEIWYGEELTQ